MTEQDEPELDKEQRLRMTARTAENMTSTAIKEVMEDAEYHTEDFDYDDVRDKFEKMASMSWDEVGMWNDFQTYLDIYVQTPFYDKYGDVITDSNSQMIDIYHEHMKQEVRNLNIVPVPEDKYPEMKTQAKLLQQIKQVAEDEEKSESERLNEILHKVNEAENL